MIASLPTAEFHLKSVEKLGGPVCRLLIEGEQPPCSGCQRIMQKASEEFKMPIKHADETETVWQWVNGVLIPR